MNPIVECILVFLVLLALAYAMGPRPPAGMS